MLLPHEKLGLIRDLAENTEKISHLAKKYGITRDGVSQFRTRNKARIAEVASHLDDEWAGLWVAKKTNRIEVLQSQAESLLAQLQHEEDNKARRELRNTLRAVAEELGQLTQKVESTGGYKISINGVDMENLK